jgi:L-fuculose-phosphate aldolase
MANTADIAISNALAAELAELARACRVLELEGHGDRAFGHMALRDPEGRGFWLKRAGIGLGEVSDARDFTLLDFDGKKRAGAGQPHGEWPIHSEIMLRRPEVMATAHTHPFYASLYSACEEPLPSIVARAHNRPGAPRRWEDTCDLICTKAMGQSMAETMGRSNVVFLRNHGLVAAGHSIADCAMTAIATEKMCREALLINASGLEFTLPPASELATVYATGNNMDAAIASERTVWDWFCRKLERAERQGHPAIATTPVPISGGRG